jgi:hypothetical protein
VHVVIVLFVGDTDSDILPYPAPAQRKRPANQQRQQKYFVLTSNEAYAAKLEYYKSKEQKEFRKQERKRKRDLEAAAKLDCKKQKAAASKTKKQNVKRTESVEHGHENKKREKGEGNENQKRKSGSSLKHTTRNINGKRRRVDMRMVLQPSENHSDSQHCTNCGILYGDEKDKKRDQDWIKCHMCNHWYHDGCAEECGVLDDENFTCKGCL